MCGIFGWSSLQLSTVQRAVLATNLGRLNDSRGGQSWGFVGIGGAKPKVKKGLGDIVDESTRLAQYSTAFGHTRFATTGAVVAKNSHPFQIGDILGAHNGIVYNHAELNTKYSRDYIVDSMHLFGHIDEELPFSEIQGYGAIEWIDAKKPGRIYLCRLRMGDLSIRGIGTYERCRGIVWSSDDKHLAESCAAADLRTFDYGTEIGQVYFIEDHKLYVAKGHTLDLGETTFTRSWRDGLWDASDHRDEPDQATMDRWQEFAKTRALSSEKGRWVKGEKGAELIPGPVTGAANDTTALKEEVKKFNGAGTVIRPSDDFAPKEDDSHKLWNEKDVWEEYQEQAAQQAADAEMDARVASLDSEITLPEELDGVTIDGEILNMSGDVSVEEAEGFINAETLAEWQREMNDFPSEEKRVKVG